MIKKIVASLALVATFATSALADEGMWMLPLIQKMNGKAMKEAGLKISPADIYNANKSSLKDAIVHFGGGCTGEIISEEGLVITNHHCGYSYIQALSTTQHNYLEDGYWAMNRSQEIPAPGLTVTFLKSMTDVTKNVTKALDKGKSLADISKELEEKAEKDNKNCTAQVTSFYNNNQYYLIVYKTYRDVRFVGAPPASSGKFGGETDNWMWPRHTCDFSMFRVYADAKGEPAAYSDKNVPLGCKKALNISLKGMNEGDYAMIMGYPGSTQRFQTAAQLEQMIKTNSVRIAARTVRQDVMWAEMRSDDNVGLQYANKYASSANGWKKWQGMELAFDNLGIIAKEQKKEADFMAWANQKADRRKAYGTAIQTIEDVTKASSKATLAYTLLNESIGRIEIASFASSFVNAYTRSQRAGKSVNDCLEDAYSAVARSYKDYSAALDKKEVAALMDFYRKSVESGDEIKLEGYNLATLDVNKFADDIMSSAFTSEAKMRANIKSLADAQNDPATKLAISISAKLADFSPAMRAGSDKLAEANKAFTAGLLEWKEGEPSYPDANSTMRLTYGNVKSYSPKDGVLYKHYTTLKGVMEKEDPANYEFRVPARLKEIYETKDYGQYADKDGTLHTDFLINCDITGGNSGSPVLDANGDLVGLAFDGNWESMSSDVMFEPDLQRCICVDIRFVMLMIDKFGGAGYLLDEMKIVKK